MSKNSRAWASLVVLSAMLVAFILPLVLINPSLETLTEHVAMGRSNTIPIGAFIGFWVLIALNTVSTMAMCTIVELWALRRYLDDERFQNVVIGLSEIELLGLLINRIYATRPNNNVA